MNEVNSQLAEERTERRISETKLKGNIKNMEEEMDELLLICKGCGKNLKDVSQVQPCEDCPGYCIYCCPKHHMTCTCVVCRSQYLCASTDPPMHFKYCGQCVPR